MRRIIITTIVLCMLLSLPACSGNNTSNANDGLFITPATQFTDLATYYSFINAETTYLHPYFISYDDISYLGSFVSYSYIPNETNDNSRYALRDSNGFTFYLDIVYDRNPFVNGKWLQVVNTMQDMRTHPTADGYGTIVRNGLQYDYLNGSIEKIRWNIGDVHFSVRGSQTSPLKDYPINGEKTLLTQLLSMNPADADSALREFATHMPFHVPKLVIWIGTPLLIAAAGVSTFLLLRRKKKPQKAAEISE